MYDLQTTCAEMNQRNQVAWLNVFEFLGSAKCRVFASEIGIPASFVDDPRPIEQVCAWFYENYWSGNYRSEAVLDPNEPFLAQEDAIFVAHPFFMKYSIEYL